MARYPIGTLLELEIERQPFYKTSWTSRPKKKKVLVCGENAGESLVRDTTRTISVGGGTRIPRHYRLDDEMLSSGYPRPARWFVHKVTVIGHKTGRDLAELQAEHEELKKLLK